MAGSSFKDLITKVPSGKMAPKKGHKGMKRSMRKGHR